LRTRVLVAVILLAAFAVTVRTQSDAVDPALSRLPNPNPKVVKNWAMLPDGRTWGSTAGVQGVAVDFDGNVYAAEGPISRPTAGGGITKYLKR
jgi:hypothetical protein